MPVLPLPLQLLLISDHLTPEANRSVNHEDGADAVPIRIPPPQHASLSALHVLGADAVPICIPPPQHASLSALHVLGADTVPICIPPPQHASLSALRMLAVIFFTPLLIRHLAWGVIKSGLWWSLEKLGQSPEESLVMTLKAISHLPSWSSYPRERSQSEATSVCAELPQSCPTLCNPMDCSPQGSSVHGILQP